MFPILFWTICLSAVLVSTEPLKLDFTKVPVASAPLTQRSLELPMYNDIFHQKYTVNLTVGTPPQPASLLIDTGSSDFWLPIPDSSGCAPTCPPGSFDSTKSSTFRATDLPFNASFGLTAGNLIVGQYFRDTLRIGKAVISNMTGTYFFIYRSVTTNGKTLQRPDTALLHLRNMIADSQLIMAVADIPKTFFDDGFYGIIGLSSRLGESIFINPTSPGFRKPNATFPTLYDQLQAYGYTARRAFSIWQNSISATTGHILFGGVDTAKYHGELKSAPVQTNHGMFFGWAVTLSSVIRCSAGHGHHKEEDLTAPNSNVTVILDSGAPNMYLPSAIVQNIQSSMNASTQFGFPYVPCAQRKVHSTLDFGFGGASGPRISVPQSELIYPFGAPSNIGPVHASDGTPLCYLGVIGVDGPIFLLGDTFIRSAYMVYDVDNLQVAMAQAKCDVVEENIVELAAGKGYPRRQ